MILMVQVCATDSDILHQSHPSPGDLAMGGCEFFQSVSVS